MIIKGTSRLRNQRTTRENPDNSIIQIGQNTEKNPGYLRRLAVTQAPVKNSERGKIIIVKQVPFPDYT